MSNTAQLKSALHQLVIETYDEQILSEVQSYFEKLQNEKVENRRRKMALQQMLAAQEGEQIIEFGRV